MGLYQANGKMKFLTSAQFLVGILSFYVVSSLLCSTAINGILGFVITWTKTAKENQNSKNLKSHGQITTPWPTNINS